MYKTLLSNPLWGTSLLTSLFTFFLISIRLNSLKPWPHIWSNCKNLKSWWSWAMCNFQLFASNIEDNISHQKLRNCCVAKKLMSDTFSVKFRVFRREFLRNHSVYWAQIFRDNWNCYALSIFLVFILLASWDSDKPKLMRQKVYIISIFFLLGKCLLFCKSAWTQLSLDRWGKRRVRVSDIRLRRDWHAVGRSVYHGQRNFISHGW